MGSLRRVFGAATLAVSLGACASVPPPAPKPADPLTAACAEFVALRDRELGQPQTQAPLPLSPDNARELFRRAEAFGFSGGFQLTESGRTIVSEAYGMADRARAIPMRPDTIFDVGSVAKQFTAAAILRLEEMGRLRTQDPISKHLPSVPADKSSMTIHHLLTHTAGFPHDVGEFRSRPDRDDAVRQILAADLKSPPGEKHDYSNAGYALLAAIVETASGGSYEGFLREEMWLPLGMTRTGMVLGGLDKAPVAEGHFFDGPLPANIFLADPRDGPNWLVRGAGYILSTMRDLELWGEGLRTGRVLTEESRRKLFRPHVRENDKIPSYYGYGWALFSNRDGTCRIAHDGSAGVHYDFMSFFPDREALLVSFTTQQRSAWRYFPNRAYSALAGLPIDVPPVAERPPDELKRLAGEYRLDSGAIVPVRLQEDRLYVDTLNGETLRLFSPWPILEPERTAPLGDRQALISSVMSGIDRGEYGPLLNRLRKDVDPVEERTWWEERWPRWIAENGRYLGADLAGTVEMNETVRSLALLRFERGTIAVGFIHDPDGRIYIDWMPQYLMREIFLAPQEDGSFLSWSPITKRTATVRFEGDRMIIDNGQERAEAIAR